jgi:hypothetical protein
MAGLIKELLLDYALNRLHVDVRSDLTIAIQSALLSFTQREALYLDMYLSGYNAIEIAARFIDTTEHVEGVLERIFTAIEEQSGYTDDNFIHRLELTKKYRKGGIRELHSFLALHGKSYIAHEMRE